VEEPRGGALWTARPATFTGSTFEARALALSGAEC